MNIKCNNHYMSEGAMGNLQNKTSEAKLHTWNSVVDLNLILEWKAKRYAQIKNSF